MQAEIQRTPAKALELRETFEAIQFAFVAGVSHAQAYRWGLHDPQEVAHSIACDLHGVFARSHLCQ
jgi:hypothetical protein